MTEQPRTTPLWRALLGAWVAAIAVRAATAPFVPKILYLDAIYFDFESARSFAAGQFVEGFRHWVPPLYPLLLSLPLQFTSDIELSGRLVGVFCGALAVIPAYGIGRELGGPRAGRLAAILVALQPFLVRWSVRVSSHGTYVLFFAIAMWLALRLLRRPGLGRAAAFGLAAGAAYWVRQEVTALVLATGGFVVLVSLVAPAANRGRALFRGVGTAIFVGAIFAATIAPVVYGTYAQTGRWVLSSKGGVSLFAAGRALNELADDRTQVLWETQISTMEDYKPLSFAEVDPSLAIRKWSEHFFNHVFKNSPRVYGFILLPLAVFALFARRRRPRWWLGDLFGLAFIGFNVSLLSLFYDSPRLLLASAPLVTAWSAAGLLEIGHLLRRRGTSWWLRRPGLTCVVVLTLLPFLGRNVQKFGLEISPSPEEKVGAWIRETHGERRTLMDPSGNIAFYAGASPVILPLGSVDDLLYYARHRTPPVEFLAFPEGEMRERAPDVVEALQAGSQPGVQRIFTLSVDDPIHVYRIEPIGR